jgi:outer membrane protein TolC
MALELDQGRSISTALRNRPDIIEARLRVRRADIEVKRAENQVLPRLDVSGGYGRNTNEGDWENTIKQFSNRYDGTNVALTLEMPIGNRTAGYNLRRARVERQSTGVALRDTEMGAIQEVRSALRGVRTQEERVHATGESRRLNKELYDGERRRLENDLSTPFQVRETLRNLLDAIDTELRAQLDLEVARARLLASQGILPTYYGLGTSGPPELSVDDRPPAP